MKAETKLRLIGVLEELLSVFEEFKETEETEETQEPKPKSIGYREGEGGGLVDIDWDMFPTGTKFTGTIKSVSVSGRIYKLDGEIYLCQNEQHGGIPRDENTLGYESSWTICDGSNYELMDTLVKIFSLELDPEYVPYVPEVVKINEAHEARVFPGYIVVGCQRIPNDAVREVASKLMEEATNS
jgi:hypothetical protein